MTECVLIAQNFMQFTLTISSIQDTAIVNLF